MKINEVLDEMERAYTEDIFPPLSKDEINLILSKYPGFIDRASAAMGRHLAKVIREKVTKDSEWRERYKTELIRLGYSNGEAIESAEAAEYDEDDSPEDLAKEEYWIGG